MTWWSEHSATPRFVLAKLAIRCRFVDRFVGQGPLPCVRSTVLYSWPPPSLRPVPASPVPRLPRYDEGATTSRRANPLAYGFGYGFHASLLCSCSPERS